jgi:hypothetical protein
LLETITIQAKRYKRQKKKRKDPPTQTSILELFNFLPLDNIKNSFIDLLETGYIFYHEMTQKPFLRWLKLF